MSVEPSRRVAPVLHLATPLVRRDLVAAGLGLGAVTGSGPGGRVRRSDVVAAAATTSAGRPGGGSGAPGSATSASAAPHAPVPERSAPRRRPAAPKAGDVIPLKGMRGLIAARMTQSLHEMAQLTHGYEVPMDAAIALREQLKTQWGAARVPVPSLSDMIIKASALALRAHPLLNSRIHDAELHLLEPVDIGLAVAVTGGLMVPVVRGPDRLPLERVAQESMRLVSAARRGRITLPELESPTFTVTALGAYGVDMFTPIIMPGTSAILGVGRVRDGVRWEGERPVRTQVVTLSLTFDHRAVDGAPAAEFLRTLSGLLGAPVRLLADSAAPYTPG